MLTLSICCYVYVISECVREISLSFVTFLGLVYKLGVFQGIQGCPENMRGHCFRLHAEPGKKSDAGMMNPNEIQVKEASVSGHQFEPLQISTMSIQHISKEGQISDRKWLRNCHTDNDQQCICHSAIQIVNLSPAWALPQNVELG